MARASGAAVVRADAAHAPFASGIFDIATSFDVMQCLEPDAAVVREMARMVRPGGAVVSPWPRSRCFAAITPSRGRRFGAIRQPWRERSLTQAGLQVERVSFLFGSLFPLMLSVRFVQRLLAAVSGSSRRKRYRRSHQRR